MGTDGSAYRASSFFGSHICQGSLEINVRVRLSESFEAIVVCSLVDGDVENPDVLHKVIESLTQMSLPTFEMNVKSFYDLMVYMTDQTAAALAPLGHLPRMAQLTLLRTGIADVSCTNQFLFR